MLFAFLNPGMLRATSVFKLAGNAARNPDDDTRRLLAHALREHYRSRWRGLRVSRRGDARPAVLCGAVPERPGLPVVPGEPEGWRVGLNLTAAEYVFLLDPWWNPAVEAQAIDRAHRIGQTRRVFAYRLIARDTVEEKVLELQKTKRDLAAAIIGEDNSLIRNLKREDLELLLS